MKTTLLSVRSPLVPAALLIAISFSSASAGNVSPSAPAGSTPPAAGRVDSNALYTGNPGETEVLSPGLVGHSLTGSLLISDLTNSSSVGSIADSVGVATIRGDGPSTPVVYVPPLGTANVSAKMLNFGTVPGSKNVIDMDAVALPEPSSISLALMATAIVGAAVVAQRKRTAAAAH